MSKHSKRHGIPQAKAAKVRYGIPLSEIRPKAQLLWNLSGGTPAVVRHVDDARVVIAYKSGGRVCEATVYPASLRWPDAPMTRDDVLAAVRPVEGEAA